MYNGGVKMGLRPFTTAVSLLLLIVVRPSAAALRPGRRMQMVPPTITEACNKISSFDPTIPNDYCVQTLELAPGPAKAKFDLHGLARATMNLVQKQVDEVKTQTLKIGHGAPPSLKGAVTECHSQYESAAQNVAKAMKLYDEKKFGDADYKIAMTSTGSLCQNELDEAASNDPTLRKENEDMRRLTSLTSYLIRIFDKTYNFDGTCAKATCR